MRRVQKRGGRRSSGLNTVHATSALEPLEKIADAVGTTHVLTDPDQTARYVVDERLIYQGRTRAVVRPGSTAETSRVVALCNEYDIAMVPQGGNTGYCGGATPDESGRQIVISLERLNRITSLDVNGCTMTLEAGVILSDAQNAAREHGLLFPLSMGSEGSCQIGGNLSTNAGGVAVLKYGTARELVLGLEVVLPDGRVLDQLSVLRKDNTGYDLKQLFLGAEGTLGIITTAAVKLYPQARARGVAWAAVADVDAACKLLARLRTASSDAVTSFEYVSASSLAYVISESDKINAPLDTAFEHHVLVEWTTETELGNGAGAIEIALDEAMRTELVKDVVVAQSETQRRLLWRIRESIPEAEKKLGGSIKHDVSVAVTDAPRYIERARAAIVAGWPDARLSIYGHIGDGNVHFNVLAPRGSDADAFKRTCGTAISKAVHDLAHELRGSFSAEHGIGRLKRELLAHYSNPEALELMRTLKRALDPKGLMNPGKVIVADK